MLRVLFLALTLISIAGSAFAQTAPTTVLPEERDLGQDWNAMGTAYGHVQKSMMAYIEASRRAVADATEAQARLKWVLDHWLKSCIAQQEQPK